MRFIRASWRLLFSLCAFFLLFLFVVTLFSLRILYKYDSTSFIENQSVVIDTIGVIGFKTPLFQGDNMIFKAKTIGSIIGMDPNNLSFSGFDFSKSVTGTSFSQFTFSYDSYMVGGSILAMLGLLIIIVSYSKKSLTLFGTIMLLIGSGTVFLQDATYMPFVFSIQSLNKSQGMITNFSLRELTIGITLASINLLCLLNLIFVLSKRKRVIVRKAR